MPWLLVTIPVFRSKHLFVVVRRGDGGFNVLQNSAGSAASLLGKAVEYSLSLRPCMRIDGLQMRGKACRRVIAYLVRLRRTTDRNLRIRLI